MENNRKLNINVSIEGIQLPLTVGSPEEEKIYRDAALLIQERVQKLRSLYPTLPNEKYYYVMAMLNTAVESVRSSNKNTVEPFITMVQDLTAEIDKAQEKTK